jgi:transcription-repair coupling factor (superfamily II helicase)
MSHFNSLLQKILDWDGHASSSLNLYGATTEQWSFILNSFFRESAKLISNKSQLIIASNNDEAEDFFNSLQINKDQNEIELLFYPGLEASLYSGVISSEKSFYDRLEVLSKLNRLDHNKTKFILVTSFEALSLRTPPRSFFKEFSFTIQTDDVIAPIDLAKKLVGMGYSSATSVEEPGTFIQKGQIFDIYPVGSAPVRLSYFDDLIETIFSIDLDTQKTIREKPLTEVCITPAAGILAHHDFPVTLRENLPQPGPSFKQKFEFRKALFNRLSDGLLFENYRCMCRYFSKILKHFLTTLILNKRWSRY